MQLAKLFSGQGAQKEGMGREIYESSGAASEIIDHAGADIKRLLLEASQDELNQTQNAQVAIYTLSVAKYEDFIRNDDRDVCAVAGFSLGEYSALYAAGVFNFEDGLALIKKRANLMQKIAEATPQGMVAVLGADIATVLELVENNQQNDVLQAANFNCPGQTVVAGEIMALDRLQEDAKNRGIKTIRLPVNIAGHSDLMKTVADELKIVLDNMDLKEPSLPVISNRTGRPYEMESLREDLALQVCSPVEWEKSMRYLLDIGIEDFAEIGVGSTLMGFMRKIREENNV